MLLINISIIVSDKNICRSMEDWETGANYETKNGVKRYVSEWEIYLTSCLTCWTEQWDRKRKPIRRPEAYNQTKEIND